MIDIIELAEHFGAGIVLASSDSARARNADMSGNHFGYTVPLIRAD